MGMVLWAARAEAYSYAESFSLQEDFHTSYFMAHDTEAGGVYRFHLDYTINTDLPQDNNEAYLHDSFIYLLLISPTLYPDFDALALGTDIIFGNFSQVDITAPSTNSIFSDFTADRYIYTCYFTDNINADYSSSVDVTYTLRPLEVNSVPEPSTLALIGVGMAGVLLAGLRRRS